MRLHRARLVKVHSYLAQFTSKKVGIAAEEMQHPVYTVHKSFTINLQALRQISYLESHLKYLPTK